MHILFVGMFVFVRNFVLVWKLVKIAFSSKEKEKPIFMPDALGFEYCGLERSDQKKRTGYLFFFFFLLHNGSLYQLPKLLTKSTKQPSRPLSKCNMQPSGTRGPQKITRLQFLVLFFITLMDTHIYWNSPMAALCILVTSCVTLEKSIFLVLSSLSLAELGTNCLSEITGRKRHPVSPLVVNRAATPHPSTLLFENTEVKKLQ